MVSQIYVKFIPKTMVTNEHRSKARPANLVPSLIPWLMEAKDISIKIGRNPDDLTFLMLEPVIKDVRKECLSSIMTKLGSKEESNGAWQVMIVEYQGEYYAVGGKSGYCG
ncbi:MAG: hypothetical protein QXE12_03840 [Conexivisphaerales archaeon]